MVCDRCVMTVREILEKMELDVRSVELGYADVSAEPGQVQLEELQQRLGDKGFELIRETRNKLTEQVRTGLIDYLEMLEERDEVPAVSEYLAGRTHYNYSYLSHTFSQETGTTIEQHLIRLKIERVKELLTYRELTLSEIAWKLNYSSVQYLSNQFKKVTGMTVSQFRASNDRQERSALDRIG